MAVSSKCYQLSHTSVIIFELLHTFINFIVIIITYMAIKVKLYNVKFLFLCNSMNTFHPKTDAYFNKQIKQHKKKFRF